MSMDGLTVSMRTTQALSLKKAIIWLSCIRHELYSGQVELLLARKARDESRSSTLQRVHRTNLDLYGSAKQRLIELGYDRGADPATGASR